MRRFVGTIFFRFWFWVKIGCVLLPTIVASQNIPVGTWRTHFSYQNAQRLARTDDKVFCAASNGLFSINLDNHEIRKLSKIDGLSDVGVSAMKYVDFQHVLVIGYQSGLVDFVFDNGIRHISDISNASLIGSRQINDITFSNMHTFLATDLGIVVVNTTEAKIKESFVQIGEAGSEVQAKEVEILDDMLFARTNQGIQSGSLTANLLDFNNWTRYDDASGLLSLTVVDNEIYALNGNNLFRLQGDTWTDIMIELPSDASGIFSHTDGLLTANEDSVFIFDGNKFLGIQSIMATLVNDMIWVNEVAWIADDSLGLITSSGDFLSPSGPLSDEFSRIKVADGIVYGFHAPDIITYDGTQKNDYFSFFESGVWHHGKIEHFQNVSDVAIFNGTRFFASIGDGLYDEGNDLIIRDIPSSHSAPDTLISALASNENLWVSSFGNQQPLHAWEGSRWYSFGEEQTVFNQFYEINLTQRGFLWLSGLIPGVVTFDPFEGRAQWLNTSNGLPDSVVDVAINIDDNAWLATPKGPAVYLSASSIFEFNEAILPSFENNTLFENENIYAIETDGGNRVWFATDQGLWLFDQNISEQVALFDFEHSPLPSDRVIDLAYNGISGELFILTNKGLVSYRSASSLGSLTHSHVRIFPNPVKPGYTGLVGISGLASDVIIKITDISGNLIRQLHANGGSASWDLTHNDNGKVTTGIYLFFSSTSDGEETYVGKIAVIR